MADKVVRDGKVAILVSRGFGAGWSTWNGSHPECLTNPEIVAMVEAEALPEEIAAKADELWPDGYWGGADGLRIEWVAEGAQYRIEEYDGSESIDFNDASYWSIA